jgi:hypothetical protein
VVELFRNGHSTSDSVALSGPQFHRRSEARSADVWDLIADKNSDGEYRTKSRGRRSQDAAILVSLADEMASARQGDTA